MNRLFVTIFIFTGIILFAQLTGATSPFDIRFPVAELDNCANEQECRAYCDDRAHIKACINFAKQHGLVPAETVSRAEKFADALAQGGPGGCRSHQECRAYCEDVTRIEECLAFAERVGVAPPELEEAKKVAQAVKAGARLPGGCRTKDECMRYCENPERADECLAFAEAAGFIPPEERERARRFMEIMRTEGGPGGCRSPAECERYCQDPNRFEECVSFGERNGMIPREEAEKIRRLGGKGPGGCRGPQECAQYCNDPAHQEECFSFAQEHGLIRQEELSHIREGIGRARIGLEHAPPEVASCIEEKLGKDILDKIESGLLLPGPRLGEEMRACFERFRPQIEVKVRGIFEGAPLEIRSCIEENVGAEIIERMKQGEPPAPEVADKIRFCFERFRPSEAGVPPPVAVGIFEHAPDEVRACLKRTVGEEVIERLRAGEPPSGEVGEKMRTCFESYRPSLPPRVFEQIPPDIKACLEEKLGAGVLERLLEGEHPSPEIFEKKRECFEQYRPSYEPFQQRRPPEGVPFPGEGKRPPFTSGPTSPEVVSCVRETLGEEVAKRVEQGEPIRPEIAERIRDCLTRQFQRVPPAGSSPQPPNVFPIPEGAFPQPPTSQVCIQVITPARDPASGACREFPTPCDVPPGWEKVDHCPTPEPTSALPLRAFLANILSAFGMVGR